MASAPSQREPFRLASGGIIDRTRELRFTFDGKSYAGYPGDTLASALLANGERLVGRSFKYHRPRGIFSAGAEEPNALIEVDGKALGFTPAVIPNVPIGKRNVRVSMRGYLPVEREVEIRTNTQTDLRDLQLTPERMIDSYLEAYGEVLAEHGGVTLDDTASSYPAQVAV